MVFAFLMAGKAHLSALPTLTESLAAKEKPDLSKIKQRAPSVAQMFLDRVAATLQAEAFRYPRGDGWESVTWQQVAHRIRRIAAAHPAGAFVSDGFGVVHRKQASVYDAAKLLPHYAGELVAQEVAVLERLASTERLYAVVLGGSKVSDKLTVIERLANRAHGLLIGGGMCFTFLAARGLQSEIHSCSRR